MYDRAYAAAFAVIFPRIPPFVHYAVPCPPHAGGVIPRSLRAAPITNASLLQKIYPSEVRWCPLRPRDNSDAAGHN